MKKLHMLTATASILLALAGPTLAASRNHRAADVYADGNRSGAYSYGPASAEGRNAQAFAPAQSQDRAQYSRGQNLPYPDRPYGDPGRW